MVTTLLVLMLFEKTTLGATVYPTGVPIYSDSFIPAAAQVVYYVIEHTGDLSKTPPETVTSERPSSETPLKIPDEKDNEEGQGAKPLARTHRELLNLHNALIREAKLQGIAKYQGFSEEVLSVLRETSMTTSEEQLRTVLQEALSRGHIKRADTKDMASKVMAYLEDADSDLRKAMANLKPLQYT